MKKLFTFRRLKALIDRYPNDMQLGEVIRKLYIKSTTKAEKQTKINMKLLFRKHFLVFRFINLKTQYQNDIQSIFFFEFREKYFACCKEVF